MERAYLGGWGRAVHKHEFSFTHRVFIPVLETDCITKVCVGTGMEATMRSVVVELKS